MVGIGTIVIVGWVESGTVGAVHLDAGVEGSRQKVGVVFRPEGPGGEAAVGIGWEEGNRRGFQPGGGKRTVVKSRGTAEGGAGVVAACVVFVGVAGEAIVARIHAAGEKSAKTLVH